MNIDGSSALVTGGASGLGLATARRIIERGGTVVLADISEEQGVKAVADLGDAARFVRADVTDPSAVPAALDTASAPGPLRFVVHSPGR
uniref:SDR family NAD(P)-dependent oxidoreductase n=1 Tax=Streptomyces reticuliscabiei TaxID=146821 RepID=UPI00117C58EA